MVKTTKKKAAAKGKAKGKAKRKTAPKRPAAAQASPYHAIAVELAAVRARLKGGTTPDEKVKIAAARRNIDSVRALLKLPDVSARRPAAGEPLSYERTRAEIMKVRKPKNDEFESATPGAAREKLLVAIRDLDIARVLLECNQSQSPTAYHREPWREILKAEG